VATLGSNGEAFARVRRARPRRFRGASREAGRGLTVLVSTGGGVPMVRIPPPRDACWPDGGGRSPVRGSPVEAPRRATARRTSIREADDAATRHVEGRTGRGTST